MKDFYVNRINVYKSTLSVFIDLIKRLGLPTTVRGRFHRRHGGRSPEERETPGERRTPRGTESRRRPRSPDRS